ncbi:MAG: hypothetical protein IT539_08740 [Bradyrhizobiaceae bacterium]|nr:hypothetical protein [Bradyrhizobiaceae bacterium]
MSRVKPLARASALVTVTVSIAGGFGTPAAAQYYPYPPAPPPAFYGMMEPHEADAAVRSLGLRPIAPPRPHGLVIIVHALGQEGSQVQVMLDRRTGRVRQIIRVGHGAPQMATLPPGARPYDPRPPMPEAFDDDEDAVGLPPGAGPRVITREGIEADELPPPGAGPQVVTRDREITGSVPQAALRGPVDPLLGVPKEFRNRDGRVQPVPSEPRERMAARTPSDGMPRVAPLPRPRPADAPAVAQREAPSPEAEPAKPAVPMPQAKPDKPTDDVPVQPLE